MLGFVLVALLSGVVLCHSRVDSCCAVCLGRQIAPDASQAGATATCSRVASASTYNIRAFSGRDQVSALVLDYWTSIFDEFTHPKMAGELF